MTGTGREAGRFERQKINVHIIIFGVVCLQSETVSVMSNYTMIKHFNLLLKHYLEFAKAQSKTVVLNPKCTFKL